ASRLAWWEWRKSGSPKDPLTESVQKMKLAKKDLRKEQRQEAARIRREKAEEIMAAENDSRVFYKLIRQQRKSSNPQLQTLTVNDVDRETPEEMRQGWATHFQTLATPLDNPSFDKQYKQMVDADVECIESMCREENSPIAPITESEVRTAMKRLNNNKAVDIMGLTSEHYKLASFEVTDFLTSLLNYLADSGTISAVLKEGILTPIYKKGDPTNPGNYRGITVTPVLLKILEHILNSRHTAIFQDSQSKLQKGFTSGCSSVNAALILSECILEAANCKQDLFLTTLDTQKAFDVVDHNSLLRKLYLDGVQGNDRLLLKDLYSDCSSRVKWASELSEPINIRQGVRQGGVLSTGHYKRYNNPLLLQLENRYPGMMIGSISIPHITVADDLALLAQCQTDMQVMVWDVEHSANRERYCVHPTKSHLLWYSYKKRQDLEMDIFLSGNKVDVTDSATHLGIVRNTSGNADITGRISLGRKTAYSLMGAGFHGGNGLKAAQNGHIWSTFVIPRLLYGLDVQLLKKRDIENLEKFQRKCLKQIQGLPDNVSNSACMAMLGILPLEAVLHKTLLNLFAGIISSPNSVELEIAKRQLIMREKPQKSMFTHIQSILEQYELPSIFHLISNPPSKAEWKLTLNQRIHESVESFWKSDIANKTSTKYLNPNVLKIGKCHHIWSTVRDNVHDNRRAQIKCKLLTGTYILQANRAAFNQHAVNPTCKLCSAAPETRQHFISECEFLSAERKAYRDRLSASHVITDYQTLQLSDPEFLTQITLDASVLLNTNDLGDERLGLLELYTREYLFKIHRRRIVALKRASTT
ncbi:MAG: reverse transcriptase family protein, partial [Candidatus Thiodiazotropha endolucinida]|nr:reverse transcriptase family protein [Candidatus Thiodiazotropha taylori]MCW4273060.1 reverse transcriptase family protein [Candidatus Thiodiazotropha endolucinida]